MAVVLMVGCDKVGKSTLFQAVLKETNRHICVDRFTACQWVYGNHHKHEDTPSVKYLREVEMSMNGYAGIVYVEANVEDIVERFKKHKEKDIELSDIENILNAYREYIDTTYTLPVLRLNTSKMSIDECVQEIVKFGDSIDKGVLG